MTDRSALLFQFEDAHQAACAYDTLKELGYGPSYHDGAAAPTAQMKAADVMSATRADPRDPTHPYRFRR